MPGNLTGHSAYTMNTNNQVNFITLGQLILQSTSIPTLATAIEKEGIYTFDRFGRLVKVCDTNCAFVLDLLADQYKWAIDPCVERLTDPRSPLEKNDDPPTNPDDEEVWENPFDQFGWSADVLPNFDNIFQSQIEAEPKPINKVKRKTPDAFVAGFVRLLVEIAKRDQTINIDEMPGIKKDLFAVARKFNISLDCSESTFDSYIEGLCKFKKGSRSGKYYEEHFPEYFK
jgi:hypothetical protein